MAASHNLWMKFKKAVHCVSCYSAIAAFTLLIYAGQAAAQSAEMLRQGTPDPAPPVVPQAPLVEKVLPTLAQMSPVELSRLEEMLAYEVEQAANAQTRLKGQGNVFRVTAHFDVARDVLVVDLGRAYIPVGQRYITAELEGRLHDLNVVVHDLVGGIIGNFKGVNHLFGGKPLHYYLPDPVQIPSRKSKVTPAAATPAAATVSRVMLNAGHGWYLHPTLGWTSQRDVEAGSGILEDTTTPLHVLELSTWMTQRGATVLSRPRSTSTAMHAPSGKQWWWMSSRTYVQDLLPSNPGIWNSLPTYSYLDNDQRTRPLYANLNGADALISIHTNGAPENRAKRGTEVYIQGANSGSKNSLVESQRLGLSILCHMKEVIRAKQNYAQWAVGSTPLFGNYAETRLGTMPSVIVEVGYHSNLEDAAALQNATFRTAAMKGVEKGYRMYKEGKGCETLAITSIPHTSGDFNIPFRENIYFKGNPQFPLKSTSTYTSCPSPWNCTNYTMTYSTPGAGGGSPLYYNHKCTTSSSSMVTTTFAISTVLTDADGVKSAPFTSSYTCKKPASVAITTAS